ncbi:MAG TPA: class I SAM-dependent methyltransferase [Gemmatimonadaceae bacterium]|nr:class I SAM-dependent methyltransferase [Gemmatimonadaceae bacterium]
MMFGTGDLFHYFACAGCGCVQLADPPTDLARYYPGGYHAFEPPPRRRGMRRALRVLRNRGTFAPRGLIDRALAKMFQYPVPGAADWMRRARIGSHARVLDVGCGTGALLADMATAGFDRLAGVDPFLPSEVATDASVQLVRGLVNHVDGLFDLVMLHHSFEHVPDPRATLRAVASKLAPGGCCLIRIPIASSWAWEHYREHWVQLDAPRHFFVHTVDSLRRIAGEAGLAIEATIHDSSAFQILGSELYRANRPLTELPTAFTKAEWKAASRRAHRLNAEGRGDQAAFYLRKQ